MTAFPELGSEFAGYRLERYIARGGMGLVFEATHLRLSRKRALKLLAPELAEDDEFRERFLKEARLAAELEHPNAVTVYDAGEVEGVLYLAMRYLGGGDLREILQQQGRISLERTLSLCDEVAGALDAAHALGLVHRDVKPANILFSEGQGQAFLADFGIARRQSSKGLTRTGSFLGTVDYCAPEQIESAVVDGKVDVYALGGVCFHCLTGQPPYVRETEVAVMAAHLREPPPALSRVRPDLPSALDGVIVTAMAKYPQVRYGSAGAFARALRDAAAEPQAAATVSAERPVPVPAPLPAPPEPDTETLPPPARTAVAPTEAPSRRTSRGWIAVALGASAAVIAILGATLGVLLTRDGGGVGAATQTTTPTVTETTQPQSPQPPTGPPPPPPPPAPSAKTVSLTRALVPPGAPYRCVSPFHRDHDERMGLQLRYSNGTRLQLVSEGPGDVHDAFLFCGGTSTYGIPGYASAPIGFASPSANTTVSSISGVFGGDFETGGLGRRVGLAADVSGARRCFSQTDGEGHARRFNCRFPAGTRLADVVLQLSVERDRQYGVFAGIADLRARTRPS